MPVAEPFSAVGVYNGLSGCVPKVNVLDMGDGSPYDYWTTASGYNKDSVGAVTQEQIDQSLHRIGLLYWGLYRLELDCQVINGIDPQTELIIDGTIDQSGTAIQPNKRVCSGSITTKGQPIVNEVASLVDLRLGETSLAFARLYKGDTTDEANFIGYSLGEAAFSGGFESGKSIDLYAYEGTYDAGLSLGGFAIEESYSSRAWNHTYIEINGIHMVFVGAGGGSGVNTDFNQVPPATIVTSAGNTIAKTEIISLEFWD